ncbi:hypothetical protein KKB44_05665 [Candidatus Micrarchaeota archaeon]|nr:hypothetical protein [Candidatus Micrarchaeota archaeon]
MKILGLELDSRKIAFLLIFSVLSFAFYQFNFSEIVGSESKASFTFFQFIGPIGGGILGGVAGAISVLLVEVVNFFLTGKALDLMTVIRFFPMAFAAIYFASTRKTPAFVALICIALFWLHPIGQEAWFYPLYWVIPFAATFYRQNLFVRSLGTTFTAHAVGSVAFLYAFNLPAEVWIALIPIVAMERLAFAAGISVMHYAVTTMLSAFSSRIDFSFLNIETKYALWRA